MKPDDVTEYATATLETARRDILSLSERVAALEAAQSTIVDVSSQFESVCASNSHLNWTGP